MIIKVILSYLTGHGTMSALKGVATSTGREKMGRYFLFPFLYLPIDRRSVDKLYTVFN